MTDTKKPSTIDPLSFVIQECTFITSAMRKSTKSSSATGPLSALLGSQFLRDSSPFIEDDSPRVPGFMKSGNKFKDDDHFLSGFVELRSILSEIKSLDEIDILTLLQPFLVLIRSPNTTGFITGVALNSLSKFIKYGIIHTSQKNIHQCLGQIISALSHCKFEGADQTQDDILLIKIIQLLELIVASSLGDMLTDDSMYEAVSTCFSLAINTRRREILRSAAETTLIGITQKIFTKLQFIAVDSSINHNIKTQEIELTANDVTGLPDDTIGGTQKPEVDSDESELTPTEDSEKAQPSAEDETEKQHPNEQQQDAPADIVETQQERYPDEPETDPFASNTLNSTSISDEDQVPFGIPCMKEYMNHTIDILSPTNQFRFTESSRVLALNILNTIVEVSGGELPKHHVLFQLISDKTCHHLVQLVQSTESPYLLTLSMKLFLNLALNMNQYLKIQIELMLTTIFQAIVADFTMLDKDLKKNNEKVFKMSAKGSYETEVLTEDEIETLSKEFQTGRTPAIKEILVETLSVLWIRSPSFFIDIFKFYDCDFDRSDMSENLIEILCRLSLSDVTLFTTNNVPPICMEGLLFLVDGIYERIRSATKAGIDFNSLEPNPLILQQIKKSDFIECTKKWNEKPSEGLKLLQEKGFIKDLNDVKEVATFLFKNSGRIDKKKLGELLAKSSNNEMLVEFLRSLDFKNLRPDEALRIMLNNFRLPGEAQQIDRIVETFNDRYIECQQEVADDTPGDPDSERVTPDKDSMYVLAFSIILLNTDVHNPNVKKPMTLEDYQRNLRGCYNGKDFPQWYSEKIYSDIKEREIIMPEEHQGTSKWFETIWQTLLAEQNSKLSTENDIDAIKFNSLEKLEDSLQFDKLIFKKTARYIVSTLITMFDDTTHDSVVTRMISTVEKCALIGSYFGLSDTVDEIIDVVAHMTTLTGIKKSEFTNDSREIIPTVELKLENENETIVVSDLAVLFGRDFRAQLSVVVLFRIVKKINYRVSKNWSSIVKIILKLFENGLIDPNLFPEFQKKLNLESLSKPRSQFQLNRAKPLKESGLFSTFSSYLKGLSDDTPEPTDEEIECTLSTIDCIKSSGTGTLLRTVSKTSADNLNMLVSILLDSLPSKNDSELSHYVDEALFVLEICICYLLLTGDQEKVVATLNKCDELFTPGEGIEMASQVRVIAYKLLLLHNGNESNADLLESTIESIHNIAKKNRESLVKYGSTILNPLQMLVLTKGTWCQSLLTQNSQYWTLIRIFASTPKNTDIVYQFLYNFIERSPELITYSNYMDILGLLDEISAVGAYGAQWEQEYDKLTSSGHKVEKNKNPFQELVSTALKSITLTMELAKIIETDAFIATIDGDDKPSGWYPLIEAIAHQCYNPCRELRAHALKSLTALLVSNDIPLDKLSSELLLDAGCVRLLAELLKPDVESTDPIGMLRTQHDVLSLSTKVILIYQFDDLNSVVGKVLSLVSKFLIKNRNNTNFADEVLEIIKNMLLVKKPDLDLENLLNLKIEKSLKILIRDVNIDKVAVEAKA